MVSKDYAEKIMAERTDGGIVVGRTLVHSVVGDSEQFVETAELARYCQLLALRLRLPLGECQKVVLAAWLSALTDRMEMIQPLVQDFALGDVFLPSGQLNDSDVSNTPAQVLSVIMACRKLSKEETDPPLDADAVFERLRRDWAVNPQRLNVLNKLMLVLRDEMFLTNLEAGGAKVLIVDPAEVVSSVLSLPLMSKGYLINVVANAEAALKVLEWELPDVIVIEFKMPIEDGLSLCTKIKTNDATRHVPVIMLAASKSQRLERDCLKAGAEDLVGKPVDIELFFMKLQKILATAAPRPQAGGGGGVSGSLKDVALSDLVQILCAGLKSTKVELSHEDETGVIYIRNGEIIEIETGELRSEAAFYRLLAWKDGSFTTSECKTFPPQAIHIPAMSLLMEAARRNDERAGGEAKNG